MIHEGDVVLITGALHPKIMYKNMVGVVERAEFRNFIMIKLPHIEEAEGPFFEEDLDVLETFEDTVRRRYGEEYL